MGIYAISASYFVLKYQNNAKDNAWLKDIVTPVKHFFFFKLQIKRSRRLLFVEKNFLTHLFLDFFFFLLTMLGSSLCQQAQQLQCVGSLGVACGILVPQPGTKPVSPALEGGFLTTGPPGMSHSWTFK